MSGAGWADYNESRPFGKCDAVITADNIAYSKIRHAASKAVTNGVATPEQAALVAQTDADMRAIIANRQTD